MLFKKETADSEVVDMFIKRLISTILLLVVFGASIFAQDPLNKIVFLILSSLLTFALVREICDIVKNIGMETFKNETALCCMLSIFSFNSVLIMLLSPFCRIGKTFMLTFAVLFCIALTGPLFILFSKNSGEKIRKLLNSISIFFFVFVPILFIVGIYHFGNKFYINKFNYYFLIFVLLTKIGDIGAYVIGTVSNKLMKGGNHKMVPSISPGKSWEGAVGGLTVTIALSLVFHYWLPYYDIVKNVPIAVVVGILIFFGGMAGDLMESSLKRAAGVKDSGTTIPGIGGVFDLVDSLFVTAPLTALINIFLFISFLP